MILKYKNMKLTLETAKKLYNDKTTQDWFKKQLETEFGKQLLKEFDYRNIKTFEDACEACGTTESEFNIIWKLRFRP